VALLPYKEFLTGLGLALSLSCAVAQTSGNSSAPQDEQAFSGIIGSLDLLLNESKTFDIISPDGVSYDSDGGFILFDVDGPLTCFNLIEQPVGQALSVISMDGNDHAILEGLRLADPLEYRLFSGQIAMKVPLTGACFYKSDQGFGLNGNTPVVPIDDGDQIFSDRLEGRSDLLIEFIGAPQFVRPSEVVNYTIRLSNNGTLNANAVGFQELYPSNATLFPGGQLQSGFYFCSASSGAQCPSQSEDGYIRAQDISIPPGGSVQFAVTRPVRASSTIGSTIELNAAAVDASSEGRLASWDAKTHIMTVVGEGQTIAAEVTNAVAPVANGDDTAEIRVTALDSFKNATPNVLVQLTNADGLIIQPASGVTGPDGSVTFTATTSGLAQAGTFQPQFLAPNLGPSGVSTQVDVNFVAGSPSQISAETLVDNVTANGISVATVAVEILDAWDNPVPSTSVAVDNADGLQFAQSSVATNSDGIASFVASTVEAGVYSPVFGHADILDTVASPVTFVPGNPNKLAFLVQPTTTALGAAISPAVVIEVQDAQGNRVFDDNQSQITVRLFQGATQIGTPLVSFEAVSTGQITLADLVMNQGGQDFFLRASADNVNFGISSSNSTTFEVTFPDPN